MQIKNVSRRKNAIVLISQNAQTFLCNFFYNYLVVLSALSSINSAICCVNICKTCNQASTEIIRSLGCAAHDNAMRRSVCPCVRLSVHATNRKSSTDSALSWICLSSRVLWKFRQTSSVRSDHVQMLHVT